LDPTLGTVCPVKDFLRSGLPASSGSETHKGCVGAYRAWNIDCPRRGERLAGVHRVGDGHRQRRTVVNDMHVEGVATVQVHAATEPGRGNRWRSAVDIQAGGIAPLLTVLEQVKLDRDTSRNSRSATTHGRTVTQPASGKPQGGDAGVLNRECHAVGIGIGELETEICGEALHVDGRGKPSAAGFALPAIGQFQARAIQLGAAVELHSGCDEARTKVNGCTAATLNGDDRGGRATLAEIRGRGHGLHGGRGAHTKRARVLLGGGCWLAAV